jgi:hypothetical protein
MQKDELKDILQQHASGFEIKPASASFEKVMQRRTAARNRKRTFIWSMAASFVAVSGLLLFLLSSEQQPKLASVTMPESSMNTPQSNDPSSNNNQSSEQVPAKKEQHIGSHPSDAEESNKSIVQTPPFVADKKDQVKTLTQASSNVSVAKNTKENRAAVSLPPSKSRSANNTGSVEEESASGISHTTSIVDKMKDGASTPVITPVPIDPPALAATNKPLENKASAILAKVDSAKSAAMIPFKNDSGTLLSAIVPDSVQLPLPMVQNNEKEYKWRIAALFTPQLFNSVYNSNSEASLGWMKQYLESREQNDKALYSLNTGLKLERQISKRLSISAGLLYSVVKFEEIRKVTTTKPDTLGANLGTTANNDRIIDRVNQNSFDIVFNSLEVPVQLYYTLRHKKIYYQATAGISYSYLFQTRSLVFDAGDSLNVHQTNDAKNDRLQQHNLFILGGINVGYQISKRWSCYAGPVMRYGLNSIYSKDYIIRQKPYYIGAEMGVAFSF